MKKLTKIGVSALAGSLAAVAAQAGELSVSGAAILSYTSEDVKNQDTGSGLGMKNNISFTGSGDVNGMEVSFFSTLNDANSGSSSSSLTIDMGDNGSIVFDQGVGGNGAAAYDDKTPTAYEESWDGMVATPDVAGGGSANVLSYRNTVAGFAINANYDQRVGDSDAGDGSFSGDGTGSGASIAVGLPALVDGLDAGIAYGEESTKNGTTTADDLSYVGGFANYTIGAVTVGYNMGEKSGGPAGTATTANEGMGIVFNMNDNLSVSYSQFDREFKNTGGTADVTEESKGIAVAYTMGSATLVVQQNEQDNADGSTAATADQERTEINLSLAF
jgi:outer membrane protein OmpU